jgi:hypothetical protein
MTADEALIKLIHSMNPYTTGSKMEFVHLPAPKASAAAATEEAHNLQVEIDNYKGEWGFRGGTAQIKRSLRVTYRYEMKDDNGKPNGLWATEHLLIGYAGGNH